MRSWARRSDYTIEAGFRQVRIRDQVSGAQAEADIKFGYCTEFIVMLNKRI